MLNTINEFLASAEIINEWIFGALEIQNHNLDAYSQDRFWFNHFRDNHQTIEGDVFEFGVYRGGSLISLALLAKRLGSRKHFYGFDTFGGFPEGEYHPNDSLEQFAEHNGFNKQHIRDAYLLQNIKIPRDFSMLKGNQETDSDRLKSKLELLGKSGTFSENSLEHVRKKLELIGLDNVTLVPGKFSETIERFVNSNGKSIKVFSANIDCDLYQGYLDCLPFLCDNLSQGGYIHLDEYHSLKYPGPRIAVDQYLSRTSNLKLISNNVRTGEFPRYAIVKPMNS